MNVNQFAVIITLVFVFSAAHSKASDIKTYPEVIAEFMSHFASEESFTRGHNRYYFSNHVSWDFDLLVDELCVPKFLDRHHKECDEMVSDAMERVKNESIYVSRLRKILGVTSRWEILFVRKNSAKNGVPTHRVDVSYGSNKLTLGVNVEQDKIDTFGSIEILEIDGKKVQDFLRFNRNFEFVPLGEN